MFKLLVHKTLSKEANWTKFSINIATPHEYYGKNLYNTLSIYIANHYWHFELPGFIKPKKKWVDCTKDSWHKPTDPPGYWSYIQKQYGFTFTDEALAISYGIQPHCYISDDPANSDHSKHFWYPWNLEHVRWDAYYLNGMYLCPGQHMSQYEMQRMRRGNFRAEQDPEDRAKQFQTLTWFTLPRSKAYALNYKYKDGEYNNWSDTDVDFQNIFRFYKYTDKYDGSETVARVHIEEREWIKGRYKWIRAITKHFSACRLVKRSLDIEFRDEVGGRKCSWKGGTIGCSEPMLPGETVEDCWRRFCKERYFK